MIQDSFVLGDFVVKAAKALLKLVLDFISAFPVILILLGLFAVFVLLAVILVMFYLVLKWSGKSLLSFGH